MTLLAVLSADRLEGISLAALNDLAELHTRRERKYVIDDDVLGRMLDAQHDDVAVLDIDGRREFTYESVYFDTADLSLYRAAATGRRHRFKVRTRVYVDSGVAMLEVKTKDGRGKTVKTRIDYDLADRAVLTPAGRRFVDGVVGVPGAADGLQPALTTRYMRTTLVDLTLGTRATIDRELVSTDFSARTVALGEAIVESKSDGTASLIDRWLWSHGIRPVNISKFCTAMASMHPELPANKWHRTLGRHFPRA
jgi:hypothetical protein